MFYFTSLETDVRLSLKVNSLNKQCCKHLASLYNFSRCHLLNPKEPPPAKEMKPLCFMLVVHLILAVCFFESSECQSTPKNFYNLWKEQQKHKNLTQSYDDEDANYDDYLIEEKSTAKDDYDELSEADTEISRRARPKTTTTTTTTHSPAYDDEIYDDTEEVNTSQTRLEHAHKLRKQCPSLCTCDFVHVENKRAKRKTSEDYSEGEYNSNEDASSASSTTHGVDYEYNYEEEEEEYNSKEAKSYDIYVDCSGKGLYSISNLFDYDFPLDQIVSL